MTRLRLILVLVAGTIVPLDAQQSAPAFEVAAIKPFKPGARHPDLLQCLDRFEPPSCRRYPSGTCAVAS